MTKYPFQHDSRKRKSYAKTWGGADLEGIFIAFYLFPVTLIPFLTCRFVTF